MGFAECSTDAMLCEHLVALCKVRSHYTIFPHSNFSIILALNDISRAARKLVEMPDTKLMSQMFKYKIFCSRVGV
jgi:hypothetical protein